jgi:hypothetical protein
MSRAIVAFGGQTELAWLRVLRPGFRHCFVLVEILAHDLGRDKDRGEKMQSGAWVLYNPLSNGTQIAVWPVIDEDTVRAWLSQHGYTVVETTRRPMTPRVFGWRPYTCVEAVKRALGLHAPGVFTPWQLYCFIKKTHKRKKILDKGG